MRKFFSMIFILLIIFINVKVVRAALPNSIGPIQQIGSKIEDNLGYGMYLKVGSGYATICTDYYKTTPAGNNVSCSITDQWDERIRYGVAAIIKNAKDDIKTTENTKQYFAAEMAINVFLYKKGVGAKSLAGENLSSGYTGTYSDIYQTYLDAANTAYSNYSEVDVNLSTSDLRFTLDGSNYISNIIEVSGVDNYTVNTNIGDKIIRTDGNKFHLEIPAINITNDTTITVSVTSFKDYEQARNYNCGSSYQSVTPVYLETKRLTDTAEIDGTISPRGTLTINKYDGNNKHLSGATIKITGPNNYTKTLTTEGKTIVLENLVYGTYTIIETNAPTGYVKSEPKVVTLSASGKRKTVDLVNTKNKITFSKKDAIGNAELPGATLEIQDKDGNTLHKWISTSTPKVIEGMAPGTYYFVETIAPEGYVLSKEKVKFEITNTTSTKTVTMSNKLNKVVISKKDATGKTELPGATLHVLDKDKKSMSCTILKDGKEQKLDKCTWVSGTKSVEIIGLKAGKYYLKETIAPDKYVLSEEMVSFEVKDDQDVTNVVMKNKLNKVVISKINAFTKKELPGATLEIQNEKGEIVKYCSDEEKNNECKWVSTEESYVVEGLPNGTYYLVETIAPKGFVLNKEKVKFTVDGKTAISYVQMENELEVEVPDTLSSRSVLLVAISMFDIALGIGIINYVKKNKYQE